MTTVLLKSHNLLTFKPSCEYGFLLSAEHRVILKMITVKKYWWFNLKN